MRHRFLSLPLVETQGFGEDKAAPLAVTIAEQSWRDSRRIVPASLLGRQGEARLTWSRIATPTLGARRGG